MNVCVLVTRPKNQAEVLCRLLEQAGCLSMRLPVIEIEALQQSKNTFFLDKVAGYDWLVFVSVNAVKFSLAVWPQAQQIVCKQNIAAVGLATAQAIEAVGVDVDVIPESGFNSEALLVALSEQQVSGQKILIVRGQGGREWLADRLRFLGAEVDYWEVYRRIKPPISHQVMIGLEIGSKVDIVTITSTEALDNLLAMVDDDINRVLKLKPLIVISERIRKKALGLGFKHVVVTQTPAPKDIVVAVKSISNGEDCG
ncbi:MAG TPA: uroporphyrinogen-III synthase [Methylococcaceae bacterium]|nr:uroporphyrinogen-III synthase [Methylococcaceae bacterium]HIA45707.1 uroporphyrinogen-III synthase [Methylococcaceae bacterium]HIO13237.1 uroporphyrinogen-III synthase [Methylococcales bacterium]